MKCVKCGAEIGEARACRWCGTVQPSAEQDGSSEPNPEQPEESAESAGVEETGSSEPPEDVRDTHNPWQPESSDKSSVTAGTEPSPENEKRKHAGKGRRLVAINAGIAAVLIAFIAFTLATAERWEKVDVPAHEDLSSAREVPTGYYIVTMDNVNPCYVGQDWTDCINAYIAQYNAACTLPLPPSARPRRSSSAQYNAACTLPLSERNVLIRDDSGYHIARDTPHNETHPVPKAAIRVTPHSSIRANSQELCQDYADMISGMQAEDQPGYYVTSLGSWGHLTATPETETVYNIIPAQTHEAVCYLGFIGECRQDDTTEGN